MYRLNDEKAYLDKVDGNLVVILTETFVYYTFNTLAGAVLEDIIAGADVKDVKAALSKRYDAQEVEREVDRMIGELQSAGMLVHTDKASAEGRDLIVDGINAEKFELVIDHYDDVAEYFAADPIHEVDPEMGWPHLK